MTNFNICREAHLAYVECPLCGRETAFEATDEELDRLTLVANKKMLVSEAIPSQTRSVREAFISGTCAYCWNKMAPLAIERRHYSIDNDMDGDARYLVSIKLTDEEWITAEVYARNAFQAVNNAVESLVGLIDRLPVASYGEYLEAKEEGAKIGPIYDLPCTYVLEKSLVKVVRLSDEPVIEEPVYHVYQSPDEGEETS